MIWFLDFRDRNQGGPVVPGHLMVPPPPLGDPNATLDLLSIQTCVVFLIHGFNVNRTSGQEKLAAFASAIQTPEHSALVAVTWPGDSWAGAASYPLEGNDADDTAAEFAKFIHWAIPGGTELSFVSHSLGARVLFATLKRLQEVAPGDYPVPQVCVMAPAVDDYSVSDPRDYRAPVETTGRVAGLASERDNVLRWAFPLGDLVQSFLFFWKDTSGLALGYHGPRPAGDQPVPGTVAITQIPTSCGVDHGDYVWVGAPNPLQARAAKFAKKVVSGSADLSY